MRKQERMFRPLREQIANKTMLLPFLAPWVMTTLFVAGSKKEQGMYDSATSSI
jgi:hypothetical protein